MLKIAAGVSARSLQRACFGELRGFGSIAFSVSACGVCMCVWRSVDVCGGVWMRVVSVCGGVWVCVVE